MVSRTEEEASGFLKGLSRALGRIVGANSLVSAEETDRLMLFIARRWPSLRPTMRKEWQAHARAGVEETTARLAAAFDDFPVFYVGTPSRECGAVRLGMRTALSRALPLVDLDGNDLWLIKPTLDNALVLGWVEDYIDPVSLGPARGRQYELHVRGSEWVEIAERAAGG